MKQKVGRYQVLRQIGRGGMGVVYLAEDPVLTRQVAIKTVELTVDDPEKRDFLLDRLIRDGRAAAGLSHPNIVSVYDVLEEGDCGYLVMEYVPGESLAAYLRRTPRPNFPFIGRVLREMASALDYTHARGVVHRDIKPANVMLDSTGAAKIMDFGIARIAASSTRTATGMVMGTLEYMAPEQIQGQPVDGRADQFSLAAMTYEMLSGEPIFSSESLVALTYKIVHEPAPPLRKRVPDTPVGVEEVVARALRKQPAERFPTCGGFAAALERAFAGEVPTTGQVTHAFAPPETSGPPPPTAASGKRGLLVGVAGVAGAAVIGAGLLYWKPWVKPLVPVSAPPATTAAVVAAPPKAAPPKAVPKAPAPAADDSDPGDAEAQPEARQAIQSAEASDRAGRYEEAIQQYTAAIAAHPKFFKPRFGRALAYQRLNRFQDAIADYSAILSSNPRNAVAMAQRGVCEARLNDDSAAQGDIDQSFQLRSDVAPAYFGRGLLLLHRKNFAQAIADFNHAIQINPDFAPAYRNRGNAQQALGNRAAADADLKKADELEGRHSQ